MKKLTAIIFLMILTGCSSSKEVNISGDLQAYASVDDWGSGIETVTLNLDHVLDKVTIDDFQVEEVKNATDWSQDDFPVVEVKSQRTIKEVYLCDKQGNKVEKPSKNIKIVMNVLNGEGGYINYDAHTQLNTYCDPYQLNITINKDSKLTSNENRIKEFIIDGSIEKLTTEADQFKIDSFIASDKTNYQYATYEPETKSDTLVVWLHGVGEGGVDNTDPYVTLLANEAANLGGEYFQNAIGGANILVPQAPTFWMDQDGSGKLPTSWSDGDQQSSFYLESLYELIIDYKDKTGSNKVVIAGASNGGYMTMLMAQIFGEKFQAYLPICEAYSDRLISDDQINQLKNLPMFFIYSKDDPTVTPSLHSEATVNRLIASGANIEVYAPDHIYDTTNRFKDEEGNPTTYNGHFAWIEFFNNTAKTSDGTPVWDWIKNQIQ